MFMQAGIGEVGRNRVTVQLIGGCRNRSFTAYCSDTINFMFYGPSRVVSPDDYERVGASWLSGVSFRNLNHWSQLQHRANGLWMYDFGTDCNLNSPRRNKTLSETCNQARYGQLQPPQYDLSQVTARTAIFEGQEDMMATKADVAKLRKAWKADVVYDVSFPKTAHMVGGVWGAGWRKGVVLGVADFLQG